jgi:hypothetical protein
VSRETPGLFGEKAKNALRHFLRGIRILEDAHRGAMHEPKMALDDRRKCLLIAASDESTKTFGVGR